MKTTTTPESAAGTDICRHHWVIEPPNGATSRGHCKLCGVDKVFRNSSEEFSWDSDHFNLGGRRGSRVEEKVQGV